MSMLSAQCDELRSMATSIGLEVPQAATLMMGAADAIDRLNAENAKLREQIETLVMYVESDGTMYWVDDDGNQHFDHSAVKDDAAARWYTDRLRDANRGLREVMTESAKLREENERFVIKLNVEHIARQNVESENAKLRELVRDMHKALFSLNLDHCQACPREDACVFVHKSFDCDECAFERDMRELGIEVDG